MNSTETIIEQDHGTITGEGHRDDTRLGVKPMDCKKEGWGD